MNAVKVGVKRGERGLQELARKAYWHILGRGHTTSSLAQALGVSTATMARAIARLRKDVVARGEELVSVKAGKRWRFELRGGEDRSRSRWQKLRKYGGFIAKWRGSRKKTDDDIIYGER